MEVNVDKVLTEKEFLKHQLKEKINECVKSLHYMNSLYEGLVLEIRKI